MTEALRRELLDKGGTSDDWDQAMTSGVAASDQVWVDAKVEKDEALKFAQRVMTQGMLIEHECYDVRGAPQGVAIIRLKDWVEYGSGLLAADHVIASDPYYQWYGLNDLRDGGGVFHVCTGSRRSCRVRLPRGDRRELVHLERWGVMTPMKMLESSYTADLGKLAIKEWVKEFQKKVPEPARPPVGGKGKGVGSHDPTGGGPHSG
eukprot:Skav221073  [mRNA]  locus=scaffold3118:301772:302386:- [translate_table: standard]